MNSTGLGVALSLSIGPLVCATCGERATCVGRYENMVDMEPACDECCGHGCEDGLCHRVEVREASDHSNDDEPGFECSCGESGDSSEPARDAQAHLIDHLNRYYTDDK